MDPQASLDTLSVETPESVAFAYELAGPASRGAALIVDTALLGAIIAAEVLLVILVATALPDVTDAVWWFVGAGIVAAFATYWGYYIWGEVMRNGRTPGKRALGIRVVRDDGSRLGVLDSIIRNLIRIVDIMPGYYAVGLASMLLSRANKRLGDMAAGTVVVRDSGELDLAFDGGRSSERESLVREFIARRAGLTPAARWQVAAQLLTLWGEVPQPGWDEPVVAGRLADLAGMRSMVGAPPAAPPATPSAAPPAAPPAAPFAGGASPAVPGVE